MSRLAFLVLLVCLALCRGALADGKVFAAGSAKVSIPDQDAMIVWRDGVQTLIIETRFVGPGRDFAWVVPLPAAPEITPASTGLFPTLRALTAPLLHKSVPPLWFLLLYASLLILGTMQLRSFWSRVAVLLLAILLPVPCLLPALGTARGLSGEGPPVRVLDRRIVGSFDVSTVASTDPAALGAWLTDNGFGLSAAAHPVIADYSAKGWVFAAAKLHRDEDTSSPSTPHPLAFTFPAAEPVYPLRLTAVENGNLDVDLYVFGPGRAQASGFTVARCAEAIAAEPGSVRMHRPWLDAIPISHSGLKSLNGTGLTLTKLSARLTPRDMERDAVIRFAAPRPYLPEFFTRDASAMRACNIAAGAFLVCSLVIAFLRTPRARGVRVPKAIAVSLLISAAVGATAFLITPVREAQGGLRDSYRRGRQVQDVASAVLLEAEMYRGAGKTPDATWVRAMIASITTTMVQDGDLKLEEGDGPGCYSFTVKPGGEITFSWYDDFGQESRYGD